MTVTYLGLGSNLGDRRWHLEEAMRRLEASGAVRLVRRSSVYETSPVGPADQPRFFNMVVAAETSLEPEALLALAHQVEAGLGRARGERWDPRTVDIDILLYGNLTAMTPSLIIPHHEMHRRAFVLVPLLEIAPDLAHPFLGRLADLRADLPAAQEVRPLHDPWEGARRGLATRYMGRPLVPHERVASTNDVARELAGRGACEGTAVVAEEQSGGRGRLGRRWHSPPGGLWLSVILRPSGPAAPRLGLALAAGAAAAIRDAAGADVRLKWPNDLILDGRKLGGILLEVAGEVIIAGLGVNVNVDVSRLPPDIRPLATSLRAHLGRPVDRAALLARMLGELEAAYDTCRTGPPRAALDRWRRFAITLGRDVSVTVPGERVDGVAEDVDDDGALLVRRPDGSLRRVVAGELLVTGRERA